MPTSSIKAVIEVNIFERSEQSLPVGRQQVRRWLRSALRTMEGDMTLNIAWVDKAQAKRLNQQFRKKSYAPNVLTFALDDSEADIVLCADVLFAEALKQKKSPAHHLAHLLVHGALHAVGYDHEKDDEAQEMEALETRILKRFRIADPYA